MNAPFGCRAGSMHLADLKMLAEEDDSFDEALDVIGKAERNIETFKSTQNADVYQDVGCTSEQASAGKLRDRG